MASKTSSFNRHVLRTILKEKAHFRNVRQSNSRSSSKGKNPFLEDKSPERELQAFLYDSLVKVAHLGSKYFLIAWAGGNDPESFDAYTRLFNKCLTGRWNVTVVDDVDGGGIPGWHISRL